MKQINELMKEESEWSPLEDKFLSKFRKEIKTYKSDPKNSNK